MKSGENIKKMRIEKGMSQMQLAKKSGVSIATIQGYEQGKYNITKVETACKIAAAIGCNLSDLIDGYSIDAPEPDEKTKLQEGNQAGELIKKYRKEKGIDSRKNLIQNE